MRREYTLDIFHFMVQKSGARHISTYLQVKEYLDNGIKTDNLIIK